jgi:hypothetical protein
VRRKRVLKIVFGCVEGKISDKQFIIHYVMFYLDGPWLPRVFPTIGLRIINEPSSSEDLPRLESNE